MPRLRAIIADDDPLSRYVLTVILAEAGVQVVADAADGAALVAIAKSIDHDLIVTDLKMRNVGGVVAVQELYASGHAKPLIFVSAKVAVSEVEEFPHSVFLPKPLWPGQMKAAVPAALQKFKQYLRSRIPEPDKAA